MRVWLRGLLVVPIALNGCGDSSGSSAGGEPSFQHERAINASGITLHPHQPFVLELEPDGMEHPGDTFVSGEDRVAMEWTRDTLHTFTLDLADPNEVSFSLVGETGDSLVSLSATQPQQTANLAAGTYRLAMRNHTPNPKLLFVLPGSTTVRDSCPGCRLDDVDWSNALLHRADLSRLGLQNANLRGAKAREANFRLADLSGADLRGADLRGASLNAANLRGAQLDGADLSGANLEGSVIDSNTTAADATGAESFQAAILTAGAVTLFASSPDLTVPPGTSQFIANPGQVVTASYGRVYVSAGATLVVAGDANLSIDTLIIEAGTPVAATILLLGFPGVNGAPGADGKDGRVGTVAKKGSAGTNGADGGNGVSGLAAPSLTLTVGSVQGSLWIFSTPGNGGNGGKGGNGGNGGWEPVFPSSIRNFSAGDGGNGGNAGNAGLGSTTAITVTDAGSQFLFEVIFEEDSSAAGVPSTGGKGGTARTSSKDGVDGVDGLAAQSYRSGRFSCTVGGLPCNGQCFVAGTPCP